MGVRCLFFPIVVLRMPHTTRNNTPVPSEDLMSDMGLWGSSSLGPLGCSHGNCPSGKGTTPSTGSLPSTPMWLHCLGNPSPAPRLSSSLMKNPPSRTGSLQCFPKTSTPILAPIHGDSMIRSWERMIPSMNVLYIESIQEDLGNSFRSILGV
jgi:hypothetical protein